MKYVRVRYQGAVRWGTLKGDTVFTLDRPPYGGGINYDGGSLPFAQCDLLAPCEPSKIVLVGKNYYDHAVEMNDGIYHEFTYIGEADINLLMENDGGYDDEGEELAGTYDNDDEEMSICFNSDGTCTISTTSFEFDGYYEVDSNGNLYIDTGDELLGGYYDSSDDTFALEDMSGWFYYTGSAGYTP